MKTCDAHTDFLTEVRNKNEREEYVKSIRKVAGRISCAVVTTNSTICWKDVENFKSEVDYYNKKYHSKFLLSIEDLGFIKSIDELYELIKLKPVSVTLTWNNENQFAGGAHTNKGLTKLGVKVIKILEQNDILIDTAHLSRKAFFEFARITTKPIFNSHSNVNSLFKHKRNLTDKQIKKIVDSGGFLGLTFYEKFISNGKITIKDVACQFEYLIKKFGYKNFGLGTDLFGVEKSFLPENFSSYMDIKELMKELQALKCSKRIVKAIIYKNYENFLRKLSWNN